MTWTELRLRLRRLLMRQRAERDLQDEVDFHLAMAARAGWRAEASFGGTDRILEECRDLRRFGWLEDGWSDLVLALRRLRHAPLFAFAAVATLGLAIGANSAVFSIVDAVVLRPLPVSNPQQLVSLGDPGFSSLNSGEDDHQVGAPTFHQYQLLRDNSPEFSGVAAQLAEPWELQVAWGRQTGAEQVSATMVSGNFFSLLGLAPARGRFFDPGPDTPAVAPDVVLSYACWQDRFAGADPSASSSRFEGKSSPSSAWPPRVFSGPRSARTRRCISRWAGSRRSSRAATCCTILPAHHASNG